MSKSNKKPKDVNAPKKNQSSYFIFSNERRSVLQKETGQSVTEISKLISGEWKKMEREQKARYEQQAAEQKKQYAEEFEAYKKTDNYAKYQQQLKQWEEREKDMGRWPTQKGGKGSKSKSGSPRKLKKPKQPEAMPKRPQSSYFIFSNQRRNQLKDQYPDKKVTELSKLIADEWRVKSAEEKKVYEDQAAVNKEKYNKEMESYKLTDEYNEFQDELQRWRKAQKAADMEVDGDEEPIKISLPRKPKDPHCPKKPLSSYFLYAQSVREQTKAEFPNVNITEIAKEISKKWKLLSEDEKKPYNEEAARLKEEYNKALEEYEGSDAQLDFKKKLAEWTEECARRKQKARAKQEKLKEAKKTPKGKGKKPTPQKKSKGGRKRKTSRSMDEDASADDSSSEPETSSSSSRTSDSSSDSESSSGSDSSSESDSESD
jgi:hypothetical protein